jgi:hypothetical protein
VAKRDGTIDRNPAHDIRVPRDGAPEKPIRLITPEETDAILEAAGADDERLGRSFACPLFTPPSGPACGPGSCSG